MDAATAAALGLAHHVRDDEIKQIRAAIDAAEPGEWKLRDGQIVRWGSRQQPWMPVSSPASLDFAARARRWVPRLVRYVAALETALRAMSSPDPAACSDADIAREFFRRFRPIQVHLGAWRGRAAVAELEDDGAWISEALPDGAGREEYADGEAGFVAALERARDLVRGR